MNDFKLAARSLFRKGRGNVIKVASLALGLAVGLILITKVVYEQRYESFYPDADRVWQVRVDYTMGQGDEKEQKKHGYRVPGGVAPSFAAEIPQVEMATRYTGVGDLVLLGPAREAVKGTVIVADSCLQRVLPRPVVAGDAAGALARPGVAILSDALAAKLGVAVGGTVEFDEFPGRSVEVGAIFEDIPLNSDFRYDMAVSMPTLGSFTWDGSENWVGNDRYYGFMKLREGTTAAEMTPLMRAVQERHGRVDELAKEGVDIRYSVTPFTAYHGADPAVGRANLLMLLLAASLIAISLLNYLIITLSTVLGRAREVAVRKCYGAGVGDIARQMAAEAAFHVGLSLAAGAVLVAAFVDQVQEILRTPIAELFSWQGVAAVAAVCLFLVAVTSWVPLRLFARVPAAAVFRVFRRSRKTWRLALLFVQFMYAAAFVAILTVIWRQYTLITTFDAGFGYENVVYANVAGVPQSVRDVAVEKLRAMPGVEGVAAASTMPYHGMSGNNISLPDADRTLFNIADLYQVDAGWFDMMEIPVVEGRGFERGVSDPAGDSEMLVDRRFAEKIMEFTGWTDGVVGKTVRVSEHGERTIVGVYENFLIGSVKNAETRPSIVGYTECQADYGVDYIMVRLSEVNGESMRAVDAALRGAMPDKRVELNAMKNDMAAMYDPERVQRNSIALCSLITLAVVLLGLVGYLRNEIARRSAEIAIRKINGAETADVLRLLVREVMVVALPALAAGCVAAHIVARRWLAGFSEQITLTPWLYALGAAAVLAVIVAVAVGVCYRIAVQNPVKSLSNN